MLEQVSATFAIIAEKLLLSGSFEEAIAMLKEGLLLYPKYPSAMCILAKAYYLSGDIEQSKTIIKTALELFPTNQSLINTYNSIFDGTIQINVDDTDAKDASVDLDEGYLLESLVENTKTDVNENSDLGEPVEIEQSREEQVDNANGDSTIMEYIEGKPKEEFNDFLQGISKIADLLKNVSNEDECADNSLLSNDTKQPNEDELIDEDAFFPEHTQAESIAADIEYQIAEEEGITSEIADISIDILNQIDLKDTLVPDEEQAAAEETEIIKEYAMDSAEEMIELTENNNEGDNVEVEIENETIEIEDVPPVYADSPNASSALYKMDLDMRRMEVPMDVVNVLPVHLEYHINYDCISFFIRSADVGSEQDVNTHSDVLDNKTQEILEIAKGLEGAKIVPIVDEVAVEGECDMPLIVSDTMAKIFTKQKKFDKAIEMYEILIVEKPDKADFYSEQIAVINAEIEKELIG